MSDAGTTETGGASRPVLELVALGVAVAAAATTWNQTFGWRAIAVPVVVATAVPTVLAVLVARRSALLRVIVNVVVLAAVAIGLVALAGSSRPFTDLLDGLTRGWGDILSTAVPVSGDPSLIVVPVVLTWIATLVGSELVLRSSRVLAPVTAPLALLIVARVVAPSGAVAAGWGPAGVIAAGVVFVATRQARFDARAASGASGASGRTSTRDLDDDEVEAHRLARRRALVALPVAVVVVLFGVVVGPRVVPASTRPAVSLRDARAPDVRTPQARDPLDELNATLADAPSTPLFTVSTAAAAVPTSATAPGNRWLLLTLDTFDGSSWGSSSAYERAGTTMPSGPEVEVPTDEVRQTITVDQLSGTWLPAVARATELRATSGDPRVTVDPVSGALATDGSAVVAGTTYEVVSKAPAPGGNDLTVARLPADPAFARFIALPPGLPRAITDTTRVAMGNAHSPFEQVAALERFLQGNGFTYDAKAPTGHGLGDLVRFLTPSATGRRGTAEQFATAFAVMARTRGLPSRLAVGFRADGQGWKVDGDVASIDVTRGDTDIWPEVYFDGLGWVAFDPMPSTGATSTAPTKAPEEVAATKSRAADAATNPQAAPAPAARNPIVEGVAADAASTTPWWLVVGVGALALVAILFVVRLVARSVGRRRRRARRRGDPDPGRRVLGAWHEVIDHLDRCGYAGDPDDGRSPHLGSATVSEVGDAVAAHAGDAAAGPVRALGRIVNDATFEPEPASSAAADQAWQLEAEIRRSVGKVDRSGQTGPVGQVLDVEPRPDPTDVEPSASPVS